MLGHLLAESREDMQAIRYLEQAAKAGDVRAQSRLGVALTEWSEYWLEKAAEADDAVAAIWLGDLRRGEGATHAALRWYRKAAELGLPVDVASRIGRLFRDRQDYKEAEKWFRIAVEEGDEEAANDLALVLEHLGAKDEAALLYRQAAEAGSSVAAHNLGIVLNEKGDPAAAREWFARAHELGDYDAAYALGHSLMRENRHDEAEAWLRKAQEVGHHQAESALADLRAARSAHRPDTPTKPALPITSRRERKPRPEHSRAPRLPPQQPRTHPGRPRTLHLGVRHRPLPRLRLAPRAPPRAPHRAAQRGRGLARDPVRGRQGGARRSAALQEPGQPRRVAARQGEDGDPGGAQGGADDASAQYRPAGPHPAAASSCPRRSPRAGSRSSRPACRS